MKKTGEKYTYLYTIFSAIPFGIGMLVGAFTLFKEIPQTKFDCFSGNVIEWGNKYMRLGKHYDQIQVLYICFQNSEYYTEINRRKEILKPYLPAAKKLKWPIKIWVKKDTHSIEQFAIGDKIILKYKPPYWQAWTFLIIGLIFTIMGPIYLVKYYKNTWIDK
jgi:hypothetical protein